MNILVTGGLGLIGHNVVYELEQLGHVVTIIDNKTNYDFVPRANLEYLHFQRSIKIRTPQIYSFDISANTNSDIDWIDWVFKKHNIDTVIHLASYPRQKLVGLNPVMASRVMIGGLVHLLELSKKYNVKKFVFASSSMVYGNFDDDVTEDHECNPQGQYGIMKLTGEWLVKDYARTSNFNYTIIRPSAVYGPLDVEDRVISKFILTAMNNGVLKVNGVDEKLDFTYSEDAAKGIVSATLSENTHNKTYNITKSHSHSLYDAAQLAIKIVGKGSIECADKHPDFPSRGKLNIDAARKDFNFDPKVDIEEGFEKYYDWLQNSPFWTCKTIR